MTAIITLLAAIISAIGTVTAAVITTRSRGPAGTAEAAGSGSMGAAGIALPPPVLTRRSKAFWLGIAGLILWVIPIFGYCVIIPGLWIGVREYQGPRRGTGAGLMMCGIAFVLAIINSAIGAWQGAHGQLWFQHGGG